MKSISLDLEISASGKRQTLVLHGADIQRVEIAVDTSEAIPTPETLDGQLCTGIFYAMSHGRRFKINGPVSEKLLRNIIQFQEAWHCHHPDLYHQVEIIPSAVHTVAQNTALPPESGSIQTFSGGVDSIFSLVRHIDQGNFAPRAMLLVHGFDIPYSNQVDFDALRGRVAKMAEVLGVELHVVKTTLRDRIPINWEHSHGAALAGVLHRFSKKHRLGVIASSDPYNYVSFVPHAWGSSPATDYLLSGSEMEIAHDGAGFSRPQKIGYLAKSFPALLRQSQFCWQGETRSENCGTCDKCVHTRLALRAAGGNENLCFDSAYHPAMLDKVIVGEETLGDILPLLDFARANGCSEPWVGDLGERIAPFLPVMYRSNRSRARSVKYLRAAIRELLPAR